MRARAGFLGGILVLLVGAGVAWLAYQAGLSQTAATATATGAAGPVVVYSGWGAGFGFFHIFGIIFGLFLLFGLARLLFGILFWRGPRHWEGRHGMSPGFGPMGPGGRGRFGPMGPWGYAGDRESYVAEMHRRLHEQDAAQPNQAASAPGAPGVTDQTNTPKA